MITIIVIDWGSTHKALRNLFAANNGLLDHTTSTGHDISGLNGYTQAYDHLINLKIDYETRTFLFLITKLKNLYNEILERAWIK